MEGIEAKRCLEKMGISVGAVNERRFVPIQLVHELCGESMDWVVKLEKKGRRIEAESLDSYCQRCGRVSTPLEVLRELTSPQEIARRLAQIRQMEEIGKDASRQMALNTFMLEKAMERVFKRASV